MKKIMSVFLMALLCACSSDSDDKEPIDIIAQHEVDLTFTATELEHFEYKKDLYLQKEVGKKPNEKFKHQYLFIYQKKNKETKLPEDYIFIDTTCPYEVSTGVYPGKMLQHLENYYERTLECGGCGSVFSYETQKAISGEAYKKGLDLIVYPSTFSDGVYHVTNPKFKK